MLRAVLLTTALVAPGQLWAQASSDGAAAIAASLQRFFPEAQGALSVTPDGSGYNVTLDFAPYLAKIPADAGAATISPLSMRLVPAANGMFDVSYDQAVSVTFNGGGEIKGVLKIDRLAGAGLYDPALGAFVDQEAIFTGTDYSQTMTMPGSSGSVVYRIGQMTMRSAATANPAGGVDVGMSYAGTDIFEEMKMPPAPFQPPMDFVLKAARYDGEGTVTGSRSLPMLDLVAFVVANAGSGDLTPALQDELKGLIRTAGPFFDSLETTGSMHDITLETAVGTFGAATLSADITINGAVAEGRFYEKLSVTGLSLPAGLLPDWAAPLVPGNSSLSFDVTGYDLAGPLAILLDRVDFSTGPDSETQGALIGAVLPLGAVDIALTIDGDATGTYLLAASGDFSVGPMSMPSGSATISLHGIDAILEKLGSAPPEIAQGAIPAIGMARGLGRAEGEATVWDIELTETGGLFVNGNDLSMFLQ